MALNLNDLSPETRNLLSALDIDGDGVLEVKELTQAANMLAEFKKTTGNIKLANLPPRLQDQLNAFDLLNHRFLVVDKASLVSFLDGSCFEAPAAKEAK